MADDILNNIPLVSAGKHRATIGFYHREPDSPHGSHVPHARSSPTIARDPRPAYRLHGCFINVARPARRTQCGLTHMEGRVTQKLKNFVPSQSFPRGSPEAKPVVAHYLAPFRR